MNRLTCTLLSGASLFALYLGGGTTAVQAAACTEATGSASNYTNAAACDYIIISGDYTNGASVINDGTVDGPPVAPLDVATITFGLPFGPAVGQFGMVVEASTVEIEGALINNGAIAFTVSGGGLTSGDVIVGIGNNGGVIGGGMVNNGTVDIVANDVGSFADFANAVGVAVTDVTGTTFLNSLGAVLSVQAFASDVSNPNNASANAIGVFQNADVGEAAIANVTNDGVMVVLATAKSSADEFRHRFGIRHASLRAGVWNCSECHGGNG